MPVLELALRLVASYASAAVALLASAEGIVERRQQPCSLEAAAVGKC